MKSPLVTTRSHNGNSAETPILTDSPGVSVHDEAARELAETLRKWTPSREYADRLLRLFAEALEVAALRLQDPRLHLSFSLSRGWPLNVTIAKRSIVWLDARRKWREFVGLLIDDPMLADQLCARHEPHVATFRFKAPETPALRVHVDRLDVVLRDVRESWHRAIRAEVARTTKAGRPYWNPYRKHNRPALYAALTDPSLRDEIVRRAFPRSWWLGVNNKRKPNGGHMHVQQLAPFLHGSGGTLEWPFGNSKPKKLYEEMRSGERVLLWTGHDRTPYETEWGLIGTASISRIGENSVLLGEIRRFARPITPYPIRRPSDTTEVRFLRACFGDDFGPLGDVFHAVYGTPKRSPVTIAELPGGAFEAVIARAASIA